MDKCEIHDEFEKRMIEEHKRINHRIQVLEANDKQIARLATNMENMLAELKDQGERLKTLENRDGEKWRRVTSQILLCVVTAVVGFLLAKFGI